jgi:hypothetical protein
MIVDINYAGVSQKRIGIHSDGKRGAAEQEDNNGY